jgi:hypothetical protein
VAEYARHLAVDRGGRLTPARRMVYELGIRLDRVVDVRDPRVLALIGRDDAPECWLDTRISRAVATFFRDTLAIQAILVPTVAYLDDSRRFNVVCFLENLPSTPRSFLPRARRRSIVTIEPAAPDADDA